MMASLPVAEIDALGLTELGFRWLHFVAGVVWIGMLYFFNWVNSAFAPTMDGETKKKVVPQLMPRALWWFRWGAAVTWLTGFFLLFLVYYGHGGVSYLLADGTKPEAMAWLPAFGFLFVGFLVYDQLFKALGKQHSLAVGLWAVISLGFASYLINVQHCSLRGAYIHVAALFGTAMAANVWMRIWPAQQRIIAAIRDGKAPDPADPALAGLRSKHNTYMSVPLLLLMVATGQPTIGSLEWYVFLPLVYVIGFAGTYWAYKQAPKVKGF